MTTVLSSLEAYIISIYEWRSCNVLSRFTCSPTWPKNVQFSIRRESRYFCWTWSFDWLLKQHVRSVNVLSLDVSAGDEEDADWLHPGRVPEPEGPGREPPPAGPDHILSPASCRYSPDRTTTTAAVRPAEPEDQNLSAGSPPPPLPVLDQPDLRTGMSSNVLRRQRLRPHRSAVCWLNSQNGQ